MSLDPLQIATFGDVRRMLLSTIADLRSGAIETSKAQAMFQGVSELNKNVQCEINAAKMCLATEGKVNEFGKIVQMGQRSIAG